MSIPFSEYTGQFFWDFKRMDNVNYNFEIVEVLYDAKKQNQNDRHFNKPLISILLSIIECMLYDFMNRIRGFRWDSFPNITPEMIASVRGSSQTDEMKKLIDICRAENLLQISSGSTLYDDLEELNKLRNRIHIQNKYNYAHADESVAFSDSKLLLAQSSFKSVCEALCNVYPRWNKSPIPMSEFPEPWN